MFFKRFHMALLLLPLFMFCGCNSAVFVEPDDLKDDAMYEIVGEDGEKSVKVSFKGLQHVGVAFVGDTDPCTYYDTSGNPVDPDADASRIARISYESNLLAYEILLKNGIVTFRSIENCTGYDRECLFWLEYGYTVRTIRFTILPSSPLQVLDISYNDEIEVKKDVDVTKKTTVAENNTSQAQWCTVFPYINSIKTFTAHTEDAWANSAVVDMRRLSFNGEGWAWGEPYTLKLNVAYKYSSDNATAKYDIQVPAYTTMKITSEVHYDRAESSGTITFCTPVRGLILNTDFTFIAISPVSHEIGIE